MQLGQVVLTHTEPSASPESGLAIHWASKPGPIHRCLAPQASCAFRCSTPQGRPWSAPDIAQLNPRVQNDATTHLSGPFEPPSGPRDDADRQDRRVAELAPSPCLGLARARWALNAVTQRTSWPTASSMRLESSAGSPAPRPHRVHRAWLPDTPPLLESPQMGVRIPPGALCDLSLGPRDISTPPRSSARGAQ